MKEIIMEQTQQRGLRKFLPSQQLKKMMTQLLISVSIFSFLFSYFHSLYSPSLLDYLRNLHHFSANPFKFSSHAMSKSWIFLICNGLLVFLSKTSGLVRCSPGFDVNDLLQKRVHGDICLQIYNNFFETKEPVLQKELSAPNVDEQRGEDLNEEMRQVSIFIAEKEEEVEEEEEEEEMLSTEELNQKFEEFIRRMKEDIMIDEARKLVIFKK